MAPQTPQTPNPHFARIFRIFSGNRPSGVYVWIIFEGSNVSDLFVAAGDETPAFELHLSFQK